MEFSKKDLERRMKEQKIEREEKKKQQDDRVAQFMQFLEDKAWTIQEIGAVMKIADELMVKRMQSKTMPVVQEWQSKTMKEFYPDETKDVTYAEKDKPTA